MERTLAGPSSLACTGWGERGELTHKCSVVVWHSVNSTLHTAASSSDLYWTAELRVQRTCSVEQSWNQPCAKTCHWLHLRQNWKRIFFRRSQWLSKTTRRCCGVFAVPVPRYKWLYLLTYILTYATLKGITYKSSDSVELTPPIWNTFNVDKRLPQDDIRLKQYSRQRMRSVDAQPRDSWTVRTGCHVAPSRYCVRWQWRHRAVASARWRQTRRDEDEGCERADCVNELVPPDPARPLTPFYCRRHRRRLRCLNTSHSLSELLFNKFRSRYHRCTKNCPGFSKRDSVPECLTGQISHPPVTISVQAGNIWVTFTSSAHDQTSYILLAGRCLAVWEIRA